MTSFIIVEDEPDLYDMLVATYQMIGVEGPAFTNGEEAVAWVEDVDMGGVDKPLPVLALIDIRLPGRISGVEVSARLRQSPYLGNMAIVLMTAYRLSADEERSAIAASGCDQLIYKPLPALGALKKLLLDAVAARTPR